MTTPSQPFHMRGALDRIGRRVRLAKPMGQFPTGQYGTAADMHEYRTGYVVEVRWEGVSPHSVLPFEYFTHDEWNEFLIEC